MKTFGAILKTAMVDVKNLMQLSVVDAIEGHCGRRRHRGRTFFHIGLAE